MTTDEIMRLVDVYAQACLDVNPLAALSARHSVYSAIARESDPDHVLVKVRRPEPDDTAALLADAKVYFAVHEADRIDAARFRCLMDHVGTVWAEDLFEYAYEPAEIIARIDAKRTQRAAGLPVIEPKK